MLLASSSSLLLSLAIYSAISLQSQSIIYDSYPWDWEDSSNSYENYSDQLLEYLRSTVQLDVWDSTVRHKDGSYKYKSTMLLKNSEQKTFELKFNINDDKNSDKIVDPITGIVTPYDRRNVMNVIQKNMDGTCIVLTVGYWNYEWCSQ